MTEANETHVVFKLRALLGHLMHFFLLTVKSWSLTGYLLHFGFVKKNDWFLLHSVELLISILLQNRNSESGNIYILERPYWVSPENFFLFQGWATYDTSICHNISWEMFFCFNWDVAGGSDSSPKQKPGPCWQCFECLWSSDDWLLEWLACHWECPRTEAQPTFLFSYQKTRLFPELWNTMGNITSSF